MNVGYLYIALIVVGVIVGIALIWFLIELVMTIRKTRKKVDEIHAQLSPTIANIEELTETIKPTVEKIDPLVEKISLTVDAANLELMRADQILENVNVVAEGVANATTAVENIASAPANLVSKAGDKISGLFSGGKAKKFIENNVAGELGDGAVGQAVSEFDDVSKVAKASKKQRRVLARRSKKAKKDAKAQSAKIQNTKPQNADSEMFIQQPGVTIDDNFDEMENFQHDMQLGSYPEPKHSHGKIKNNSQNNLKASHIREDNMNDQNQQTSKMIEDFDFNIE